MTLDLFTVTMLTALVVVITSVIFIVETLVRKEEGAGRLWALAFLAGLLTVLAYLVWSASPGSWWAVAVGNGAFVATMASMWLGCRKYNDRPITIASIVAVAGVSATAGAVLIAGPLGGDWAGALVMFVGVTVFAGLGAAECLRGEMRATPTSWGLAFALGIESLYFFIRSIVFLAVGPEDPLFVTWFDTVSTSFFTITLSIVAVVVTSVLLVGRGRTGAARGARNVTLSDDDVLPETSFVHVLLGMSARARRRSELVAVVSVRIDELPAIATAFGSEAAANVSAAFRAVVRRFAPTSAFVGEDGPTGLLVGIQPQSATSASRAAMVIRRGLFDELSGVVGAVLPVVGVGVAVSDSVGYEPADLVRAANSAASRAAADPEATVIVAPGPGQRVSR
ncbi:hypothetical protein ACFQZV_10540 [Microbacterium koreense]|uniref:GGDEF domain-containing protein n=1 Tax=Microbacterium koreense TaxID=323761 RepID=A0ABW2ZU08_9MICO